MTSIGDRAFENCSSLTSISIPSGVTSIGDDAFNYCTSLTSITIPNSVTSIGYSAFENCTSLTSIIIPSSVTNIGAFAFSGCSNLTTMIMKGTAPPTLVSISAISSATTKIFVPSSSLNAYKSATNWSTYESKIFAGDHLIYLTFEFDSITNSYTVTNCDTSATNVEIPATYDDGINGSHPVTKIGDRAFSNCSSLTSIAIPSGVTSIGDFAFSGCTSLTSIDVDPNNAYYKDDGNNMALLSKDGTIFYQYAIGNSNISYAIPSGVTNIGDSAFEDCSNLTSITIPNSVTSIGDWAFSNCFYLTSIAIPNGVTSIGSQAFSYCTNLTSITIPNSVASIGNFAFGSCPRLTSINVDSNNIYYTSIAGVLYNKECTTLITYPAGKTATNYDIPSSVTSIGNGSFRSCLSLISVNIPGSVTSIGHYAFFGCISLTEVTFLAGSSLQTIGTWAFYGCSNLISIIISEGVAIIEDYAFQNCTNLTSVTIPSSVTNIKVYSFDNCSKLTTMIMKGSTPPTLVNTYSISTATTKIYVPLSSLNAYKSATNWSTYSSKIYADPTTYLTFEFDSSTNSYTVTGCDSIVTEAEIPSIYDDGVNGVYPVTKIGDSAFFNCSSLTSITIPSGVTNIGDWAFSGCSSLTSIAIPNGVTSIGSQAFSYCTNLTSITIPNSVASIGNFAFGSCPRLTSINVDSNNIYYTSIAGVLYNKECTTLITYPAGKTATNYDIPSGVTNIENWAFYPCSSLTTMIMKGTTPPTLVSTNAISTATKKIYVPSVSLNAYKSATNWSTYESKIFAGDHLIYLTFEFDSSTNSYTVTNCDTSATGIEIPSTYEGLPVVGISATAFSGCANLVSVSIPESVTNIGNSAFYGCTSLVSVTIPENVTAIGNFVFSDCTNLESVTFDGTSQLETIGSQAFNNCTDLTSITLPSTVTNIGSAAFFGCSSLQSINIPSGVTIIETSTFYNCFNLESVTFDGVSQLETIGSQAFINCISLEEITIPENVNSIGSHAFYNCNELTTITIPSEVTTIGEGAFASCSSLISITVESGNVNFISENGVLFNSGKTTLIAYPAAKTGTSYTFPSTVTTIAAYAFNEASNLTAITIPSGVTGIGDYAFYDCSNLETMKVKSETVPALGVNAISSATTAIYVLWTQLPDYLEDWSYYSDIIFADPETYLIYEFDTETNSYTLVSCYYGAVNIVIPAEYNDGVNGLHPVKKIGGSVFAPCADLESVIIPEGIISIGEWAFSECDFVSITIPSSVTSIGNYAFSNCSNLETLTFAEGSQLESIGNSVFNNCINLETITIPSSVTSIGNSAFQNCSNLSTVIF